MTAKETGGDKAARPRRRIARQPLQERSRARVDALLDTLDAMLAEHDLDQVGFYQIAERAGVPPASVYHFFPSKNAAALALAERYLARLQTLNVSPMPSADRSWQAAIGAELDQVVAYYRRHPPAMKLLFGIQSQGEIHAADDSASKQISRMIFDKFERAYHLPFIRAPQQKFRIGLAIADAVWRLSYLDSGTITPEYAEEACRAFVAYFRTFLPETLEVRGLVAPT